MTVTPVAKQPITRRSSVGSNAMEVRLCAVVACVNVVDMRGGAEGSPPRSRGPDGLARLGLRLGRRPTSRGTPLRTAGPVNRVQPGWADAPPVAPPRLLVGVGGGMRRGDG